MTIELIKCEACGKEIASTAKSCPNCGAKVKKPINFKKIGIIVAIVAILFIGMAIFKGMNSSKIEINGSTYTTDEIIDYDNFNDIMNKRCTVTMTVKTVGDTGISANDEVEIDFDMERMDDAELALYLSTLKKGDKIKVEGYLDFVGTWQVIIDKVSSIELVN